MIRRIIDQALAVTPSNTRKRAVEALGDLGIRPGGPKMYASLKRLRRLGFQPRGVIDVGAYRGEWTREAFEVWPQTRSLMFEARQSESRHLEAVVSASNGRASYRTMLLGPESKKSAAFFELEASGTGSSVLEELSTVERKVVSLPMHRLDDQVKDFGNVDLLKLDVQGFELQVLAGAHNVLTACDVVITEVALLPYNKGAPFFDEVVQFMSSRGLVLFDIATFMFDAKDRIFQLDAVFVRREAALRGPC